MLSVHLLFPAFVVLAALACLGCAAHNSTPASPDPNTPAAKTGYAPVDGLNIYYEIHGTGDPIVLLHGGGSTIDTSFAKLIPILSRTRQVIAYEQQGHGRTADIPGRPFSFEQSADDAAGLLQYLKIDRADFMGFSNGATIALQIAIRHPQIVRKLVVVSGMYKRDAFTPDFWEGMNHASLENMPLELRTAYLKVAPHPEQLQSFHDKSVKRMLEFKDWSDSDMKSIQSPTLIINGDTDVVRPEHAVEMFRALPHARLAILPETTHATIMDRTQWQASMVETFLLGD